RQCGLRDNLWSDRNLGAGRSGADRAVPQILDGIARQELPGQVRADVFSQGGGARRPQPTDFVDEPFAARTLTPPNHHCPPTDPVAWAKSTPQSSRLSAR